MSSKNRVERKSALRAASPRHRALALSAALIGILAAGCGAPPRPALTAEELRVRSDAGRAAQQEVLGEAIDRLLARIEPEAAEAGRPEIHFLAISGGGDWGAFGAGFLVGWGESASPEHRRPDFDIVSGVSTGAMLAPFAFLGTQEDCVAIADFYRDPKPDWVKSRGPLFFLPSNISFARLPGLERDLRATVGMEFVERLAERSRENRLLVISATDLDFGRQRYWSVGAEAERAVAEQDPDRVQRIMLASAAIPAFFPPIAIDDGLYADGGVTANVFLRLDTRNPQGLLGRWIARHPGRPLPKVRYWVIVNNQRDQIPLVVQSRWPAVISPSLTTATRSATRVEIALLAAQADFVNAALGGDVEVRVVTIPDEWRPPVAGSFRKETMDSLVELGRSMGRDPASWRLIAAPRGRGAIGDPLAIDGS